MIMTNKIKVSMINLVFTIIILSIASTNIFAREIERSMEFEFEITEGIYSADQKLVVSIKTKNWMNIEKGITGFNIKLEYDHELFEYVEVKLNPESLINPSEDDFVINISSKPFINILYLDKDFTTPIPREGEILEIVFKKLSQDADNNHFFHLTGDREITDGRLPLFNTATVKYPLVVVKGEKYEKRISDINSGTGSSENGNSGTENSRDGNVNISDSGTSSSNDSNIAGDDTSKTNQSGDNTSKQPGADSKNSGQTNTDSDSIDNNNNSGESGSIVTPVRDNEKNNGLFTDFSENKDKNILTIIIFLGLAIAAIYTYYLWKQKGRIER